jgi:hypothetical protein
VFYFDVVVSVSETKAGGVFQRFAGGVVGFGDQGLEVNRH